MARLPDLSSMFILRLQKLMMPSIMQQSKQQLKKHIHSLMEMPWMQQDFCLALIAVNVSGMKDGTPLTNRWK